MEQKYIILFNNKTTAMYSCAEVAADHQIISDFWGESVDIILTLDTPEEQGVLSILQNTTVSVKLNGKEVVSGSVLLGHNDLVALKCDTNLCYLLFVDGYKCAQSLFVKMPNDGLLTIGSGRKNHIIIDHPAVLDRHAEIVADSNGLALKAASNSYTYVNALLCTQTHLNIGDCVQILNCMVYNLGDYLCVMGTFKTSDFSNYSPQMQNAQGVIISEFAPVPRVFRSIEEKTFTIDSPPAKNQPKNIPFILSSGPSLTMSLGMLVSVGMSIGNILNNGINGSFITSSFMALSMLSGALLWPMLMRKYNEKQAQEFEELRTTKYGIYLKEQEEKINQIYTDNLKILSEYLHPSATRLAGAFDEGETSKFLWERSTLDDDFLDVRLGLGHQCSGLMFQVSEKHFSLYEDSLEDAPRNIAERYSYYNDHPISLSLKQHSIVGIFGRYSYTDVVIQNVIASIIFLHSAQQVKLVFLFPNKSSAMKYQHYSNIPHVWNREKNRRFFAHTDKDSEIVLAEIYNHINLPAETNPRDQEHYIILTWSRKIETSSLYHLVKTNPSCKNVSFVFIADIYGHLPQDCKATIECRKDMHSLYIKNQNNNRLIPFRPDHVERSKLLAATKKLNALNVTAGVNSAGLPNKVGFLDLFKVGNIADLEIEKRWSKNESHDSLATPIGAVAGGEIIHLDIHENFHGCHGIVAGTTGSGKSEFLQSYILSMMVNYSPEDVNFVLIDFKGGDIATPFHGLPHLSAVISNLSTNILHRAMVSLDAERLRRQRIFDQKKTELNVDKIDINSYQKMYHSGLVMEALPHLIIIMDEFAQFKTQHSEYMQKLIDIAQIGRSLGIHLILATQKPAGVVDGQIWSNSRFKFCLKVLEQEDSKSVLKRDDAAFIKKPGTGYMQVGYNEIFTQFQAGYCRAQYTSYETYASPDALTVQMIDSIGNVLTEDMNVNTNTNASSTTQIVEVVNELNRVSKKFGFSANPIWCPALSEFVYTEDCRYSDQTSWSALTVGILDIPTEQKQSWHLHDFCKDGHLALYGASGTGKTSLVQSLLYQAVCKLTPKQFRYGIIDLSGKSYSAFADTQYSIGCVSSGETELLDALFQKIDQELAYRKEVFSEMECNSFVELVQHAPDKLPMMVIVLENYAKFRDMAYTYEERVIDLVSSGPSYGIYFIVTANSKSGIYYKVREQMQQVIVFSMVETESYRDILGVRTNMEPEDIKGRALIRYNDMAVELQVALPVRENTEHARLQAMKQKLAKNHSSSEQLPPKTQKSIEAQLPLATKQVQAMATTEVIKKFISAQESPTTMMIGRSGQTHQLNFLDLAKHKRLMLCSGAMTDFNDCCEIFLSTVPNCKKWILTGKEGDGLKSIFAEIEECTTQGILPIAIIPNFAQLYYDISDVDLNLLQRFIKNQPDTVFITCANLSGLSEFFDTALYLDLCKNASVVLFSKGQIGEKNGLRMNRFVRQLPPSVWDCVYDENQYLVVVDETYTTTYFREVQ